MICLNCDRECDPRYEPYALSYCCEDCWYNDGCPSNSTVRGMILERSDKAIEDLNDNSDMEEDVTKLIERWKNEDR